MGYTNVLPNNNTNTIGIYMRGTGSSLIEEDKRVEDFDLEHMQDMLDTEFDETPKEFTDLEQFTKWLNK